MKYVILLSAFIMASCAQDEPKISENPSVATYDSFYNQERAKVLVVGTFHFDYPGLDEVKTAENDKIDVLTEPKKSEVTALVNYIKRFKPTKIAIEAFPEWNTKEKFADYKKGLKSNERDERYQLGMRIAQELNIDALYPVDAGNMRSELWERDSIAFKELFGRIDWEVSDPYWEMAEKSFEQDDRLTKELPLIDYFKRMNTRAAHNFNYGLYLTGSFETGDGQGADHLATWWYDRNLRIFNNIQKITNDNNDRVLVIIGNGHASILRHLYEASPEFEYIEFDSL